MSDPHLENPTTITGSLRKKLPDGREVSCEWMIDLTAGTLVQIGGEGELVAEDVDLIAAMLEAGTPEQYRVKEDTD